MEGFVDIHTHILPGVDDGAQDLSQSLALLKSAYSQGTGALILTPHYRGRYQKNVSSRLNRVFRELLEAAQKECPGLQLYLGCEVGYELDVSEKIASGKVLTLNGTQYVLLEFQKGTFHTRILDGVLEVLNFGYIPIIAHAERYDAFREHPQLAEEVTRLGALLQLNADSILGKCGFRISRYCHKLLKKRLAHFVATDAHELKSRKPDLKLCYEKLQKKYGKEYADALFIHNGRTVLEGKDSIEC